MAFTGMQDELNSTDSLEEKVQAVVLSNGDVVDIEKFGTAPKNKKSKSKNTNSIDVDEDDFGEQYASGRVYRPTFNLNNMKQFSLDNLYHLRCISQIAKDSCRGWDIVNVDGRGHEVKDPSYKWSTKDNKLYSFFEDGFLGDDFIESSKATMINFNTFGVAYIELTRRRDGTPARMKVLPSETCRISRQLSDLKGFPADTDMKYIVQIVNTHERIFKIFDGEPSKMIEPHTGNPMSEVIMIRNYHVMGGKYGIPDWVASLKSMIGNDKVADYNINFFDNEAVPRFAVVVTGSKLDDEVKREIKSYFKKDLKGVQNAHKTLVISSSKGTEIKLVPLAVEMKDGGFRFYRKDNRDEIISAHGVPPHRVQVYDTGNSGSISPGLIFDMDKAYKYSIVNQMQSKLSSMYNRIIRLGFGIKDKQVKFQELDIGEDKERADILKTIASAHEKYYNIGSMTADEIRADNKQQRYEDMDAVDMETKEWAKTPKPVYLLRQARQQQADLLSGNVAGQNVNETPNDFGDKSKEQTGNTLNDKSLNSLMMKSQFDEVIQKVDTALSRLEEIEDMVNEHIEEGDSNDA